MRAGMYVWEEEGKRRREGMSIEMRGVEQASQLAFQAGLWAWQGGWGMAGINSCAGAWQRKMERNPRDGEWLEGERCITHAGFVGRVVL